MCVLLWKFICVLRHFFLAVFFLLGSGGVDFQVVAVLCGVTGLTSLTEVLCNSQRSSCSLNNVSVG